MSPNAMSRADQGQTVWHEIDDVYHEVLDLFYERGRREKAALPAVRLLRLLDRHDPRTETLLGMSGRCLVAELDEDPEEAIRFRRMEIAAVKKLLDELDADALRAIRMGPDDYSDRLDLLALNYLDAGRYEDALAALDESEAFCTAHGIPFDGADVRRDVRRAANKAGHGRTAPANSKRPAVAAARATTAAARRAGPKPNTPGRPSGRAG